MEKHNYKWKKIKTRNRYFRYLCRLILVFLRFCSANDKLNPFNKDDLKYWMPVDQYIGGVEHAILHLLYSRFFMRAISLNNKTIDY